MKFANKYNVPFLAVNRGHGTASALSNVKNGINIYVRALDTIKIGHDGDSALMGGGTYVEDVITALSAQGKISCTKFLSFDCSRLRLPRTSYRTTQTCFALFLLNTFTSPYLKNMQAANLMAFTLLDYNAYSLQLPVPAPASV